MLKSNEVILWSLLPQYLIVKSQHPIIFGFSIFGFEEQYSAFLVSVNEMRSKRVGSLNLSPNLTGISESRASGNDRICDCCDYTDLQPRPECAGFVVAVAAESPEMWRRILLESVRLDGIVDADWFFQFEFQTLIFQTLSMEFQTLHKSEVLSDIYLSWQVWGKTREVLWFRLFVFGCRLFRSSWIYTRSNKQGMGSSITTFTLETF